LEYYNRALEIRIQAFDYDHLDVAKNYNNLDVVKTYNNMGLVYQK
jgi:hypothetical protein